MEQHLNPRLGTKWHLLNFWGPEECIMDCCQADLWKEDVNGSSVLRPTFQPTKCCALHEWPQLRAALQHFEVVANGGRGPVVTNGAPCTYLHEGRIADLRCKCEIERAARRKRTLRVSARFSVVQTQRTAEMSQSDRCCTQSEWPFGQVAIAAHRKIKF